MPYCEKHKLLYLVGDRTIPVTLYFVDGTLIHMEIGRDDYSVEFHVKGDKMVLNIVGLVVVDVPHDVFNHMLDSILDGMSSVDPLIHVYDSWLCPHTLF